VATTASAAEGAVLERHAERRRSEAPAPRAKLDTREPGSCAIAPDHPDARVWQAILDAAFGTTEPAFRDRLLGQLLNTLRHGTERPLNEALVNSALATMHAIAPRSELEAMLAAQMVATHTIALDFLGRAARVEYRGTLQDYGNLAIKLLRTHTAQLEALQRLRGKTSEQKVTVEHVHVYDGGQAVVGNVEAGTRREGAKEKAGEQCHAKQLAHAPEPPLRCEDPKRHGVPVTRGSR
jgi:hypothetical protein